MLASMFFVGGANALKNTGRLAQKAQPVSDRVTTLANKIVPGAPIPTDARTLVRANAVAQLLAASCLATGRAPRLSAGLLAASLVPTTVAGHAFWNETDPVLRSNQRIQFFKNISMMGGTLIAAVDTDGKPSIGWRARRAAKVTAKRLHTVGR
jgi:uncharacterized membrane protein YphA (DoxX/SURF4 family)